MHRTKDISVDGQVIPANTLVTTIMAEVLKGDHWGDGEVFRPERFLDTEGRVVKDEHWVPFSLGRRQCLGETLARAELFLFFTALVQHYTFLPEHPGVYPGEQADFGITLLPKPFKVTLRNRI